jgi:hypothetical protein
MTTRMPTIVILATMLTVVTLTSPARAEAPQSPTTAPDGDVLCAQVEDANGNPVGPEVCIPWFLPIP